MLGLVPIHSRLRGRDPYMVQNNRTVSLLKTRRTATSPPAPIHSAFWPMSCPA